MSPHILPFTLTACRGKMRCAGPGGKVAEKQQKRKRRRELGGNEEYEWKMIGKLCQVGDEGRGEKYENEGGEQQEGVWARDEYKQLKGWWWDRYIKRGRDGWYSEGNEIKEKMEGEGQISNKGDRGGQDGGRDGSVLLEQTRRNGWICVMHDGSQSRKTTNHRLRSKWDNQSWALAAIIITHFR